MYAQLAFSPDGLYLAVGERGVKPAIIVWELKTGAVVAELRAHKHGIAAIAWEPLEPMTDQPGSDGTGDSSSANEAPRRPDLRLASCGFKLDRQVLLWDWRRGAVVAKGRAQHKVHALSFSPAGAYLVTAGERHVKFWDVPAPLSSGTNPDASMVVANAGSEAAGHASTESGGVLASGARDSSVIQMTGRLAAVVEALRGAVFVDVACSRSNNGTSSKDNCSSSRDESCIAFAVTAKGQLCAFDAAAATITSLVALEASVAYSVSVRPTSGNPSGLAANNASGVGPGMVAVGCSSGLVRLFEATPELRYVVTLPQPPPVGFLNFKSVEDLTRITEPVSDAMNNGDDEKDSITGDHTGASALRFPAALALQWLLKPQATSSSSAVANVASLVASPSSVAWQLVAIYGDRSFFVWDIASQSPPEQLPLQQQVTERPAIEASTEIGANATPSSSSSSSSSPPLLPVASVVVGKYRSFLHHAACVWDVCALPPPQQPSNTASSPSSPVGCRFATCAADNTVRIWSLDSNSNGSSNTSNALLSDGSCTTGTGQETLPPPPSPRAPNFFSREMVHAFTVDPSDVPRGKGAAAVVAEGKELSLLRPQQERGGDMGGAVVVDDVIDLEAPPCRVDRPEQLACPRALAASPDGCDLACGDRAGNVRVWGLRPRSSAHSPRLPPQSPSSSGAKNDLFPLVYAAAAHDAEVLCLDYADLPPLDEHYNSSSGVSQARNNRGDGGAFEALLATAGRDRLIHVLGAKAPKANKQPHSQDDGSGSGSSSDVSSSIGGYALLQTCEHHGGAVVTGLRFGPDGAKLFSAGGDGSMSLARVCLPPHHPLPSSSSPRRQAEARTTLPPPPSPVVSPYRTVALPHGAAYDVGAYPTGKYVVCGGNDKQLHVYSAASGKHVRAYSAEPPLEPDGAAAALASAKTRSSSGGGGAVYRLTVDSSGLYAACCTFDRWVRLMDFHSGEVLAQVAGHAELVTSLKFTADGKRLVSGGGDGCVFVWKLGSPLVGAMADRSKELEVQRLKRRAELRAAAQAAAIAAAEAAEAAAAAATNVPDPVDTIPDSDTHNEAASAAVGAPGGRKGGEATNAGAPARRSESSSSPSKSPRLRGKWAAKLSADGGAYNVLNAYQMTPMTGGSGEGQVGESEGSEALSRKQQRTLVGGKDLDSTEEEEEEDNSFDLVDPPLMARTQQPPTLDDEDYVSSFPLGKRGVGGEKGEGENPEDGDGVEMAESPNDPSSAADVSDAPLDAFPVGPTITATTTTPKAPALLAGDGVSVHLNAPQNTNAQLPACPDGQSGNTSKEGAELEDDDEDGSGEADAANDMLGQLVRSASWAPPRHARSLKLSDDDVDGDYANEADHGDVNGSSSPDRLSFTQTFRQTTRMASAAAEYSPSGIEDAHAAPAAAVAGVDGVSEASAGAPESPKRQESSPGAVALALEVANNPSIDAHTVEPDPAYNSPVRASKPSGGSAITAGNDVEFSSAGFPRNGASAAAHEGVVGASPTSGREAQGEGVGGGAESLMNEHTTPANQGPSHAGHGFSTPGKPKRGSDRASPFKHDSDANPNAGANPAGGGGAAAAAVASSSSVTNSPATAISSSASQSRQQPRASSASGAKGGVRRSLADERERLRSRDRRRDTVTALQSMNDQLASMGFLKPPSGALNGNNEESAENASTSAPSAPAAVAALRTDLAVAAGNESTAVADATPLGSAPPPKTDPLAPSSPSQGDRPGNVGADEGLGRSAGDSAVGYVSSPAASSDNASKGGEKQLNNLDAALPTPPLPLPPNNLAGEVIHQDGDDDDDALCDDSSRGDGYGQRSPLMASLATTVSGTTLSGETLQGFLVLEGRDNDENYEGDGVSSRRTELTTVSHESQTSNGDEDDEDDSDTLAQGWTGFPPNLIAEEHKAANDDNNSAAAARSEGNSSVGPVITSSDADAPAVKPPSSSEATVATARPPPPLPPAGAARDESAAVNLDATGQKQASDESVGAGMAAAEIVNGRTSPNSGGSNDSDKRSNNHNNSSSSSVSSSTNSNGSGMGPLVLPRPAEEYRASLARLQTAAQEVAQLYSELRGHAYRTGTVNSSSSFTGPTTTRSSQNGNSLDVSMLSAGWAPPSGSSGGENGRSADGTQSQHSLNHHTNNNSDTASHHHPGPAAMPAWGVAELLGEFDSTWRGLGAAGLGQMPSTSASVDVSGVSFASGIGSASSGGFGGGVLHGSFLGAPPQGSSYMMYPSGGSGGGSGGYGGGSPWRTPEKASRSSQHHHQPHHYPHHQSPAQPHFVASQDNSDTVGGTGPAAIFASADRPVPLSVCASAPMAMPHHQYQQHQHLNSRYAQTVANSADGYSNGFPLGGSEMAGVVRNPLPGSQSVDTGGLAPILERAISVGSSDRPGSPLGSDGDPATPSDHQSTSGQGFDSTLDSTLVDLATPPARPAPPPPTAVPPPAAAAAAEGVTPVPPPLLQPPESLPGAPQDSGDDNARNHVGSSSDTTNEALLPPAISAILSSKEATGGLPPPEVAHILAQYSDVLLGMVQEKLLQSPAAGARSSRETLDDTGVARESEHESLPPPPLP